MADVDGQPRAAHGLIPCEDYQCTKPHGVTRCGPTFASYHVGWTHTTDCPGGCKGLAFVKGVMCEGGEGK